MTVEHAANVLAAARRILTADRYAAWLGHTAPTCEMHGCNDPAEARTIYLCDEHAPK